MCGVLSSWTYCHVHRKVREKAILEAEPWRYVYKHPLWIAVRPRVIENDGHRCTFVLTGRRCAANAALEVHHEVKLRILWERAGKPQRGGPGWRKFIGMATDEKNLRTLCPRHHKEVDTTVERARPGQKSTSDFARRKHKPGNKSALRGIRKPRPPLDDE